MNKRLDHTPDTSFGASLESPTSAGLKWLFLDLNSYFASVEQQETPAYRGKPLIVIPSMTDSTCAIAASYEAKAYGIKTGTKVYEAKKMCPNLICVQANHERYVRYHHKIIEAAEKCLPINKTWSVDEFDCLLMGSQRIEANAVKLAQDLKQSIYDNVGNAIGCSIGIAPNSFLAKVGTEIQKPNGLVILRPEDLPGRLLDLKLTDLPGINTGISTRLAKAGIFSIEQLYNTSPKQCRAIWRSVQGERFWYWLHGYDVPYQSTSPSMMGHSRMLDPHLRAPEKTRQIGRELLFKAATRLRKKDLYAKNLVLKLRLLDGRKWYGFRDFPATQDPFTMLKLMDDLWTQMCLDCFGTATPHFSDNKKIFLKIATLLNGLCSQESITNDLFQQQANQTSDDTEKKWKLIESLDSLQSKYKKKVVSLGMTPKTTAGDVGTKIAFNRVPKKEEFWN